MSGASLPLKRTLLAMLGGTAPPQLGGEAWDALDAMAQEHRLQPLLAWQFERAGGAWPAPEAIAQGWREARRLAGVLALAQGAALRLAADSLARAGIPFMVLKGPRLAWRCYPEPGLRPMRDLDLLVPHDAVLRAADVLAAAGFSHGRGEAVLAEALAEDKHLPAMAHAGLGVEVELHHRLSDLPGGHAYRVPQLDPAAALARREQVTLSGVILPAQPPADLLAHLMVHALYGHRLDCGPLVLADLHYLLATEPVDAGALRRLAEQGGWLRGAELLLALTRRYFGPQPLALGAEPPEEMLAAAEDALLQDLSRRRHAIMMSDLLAARSPAAFIAGVTKRLSPPEHVIAREGGGISRWRFWPVWALRRLGTLGRGMADRRASREAGRSAALMRWLQG